jgi:hypothetical protein
LDVVVEVAVDMDEMEGAWEGADEEAGPLFLNIVFLIL